MKPSLLLLSALTAATSLNAQQLVYEGFDYPVGSTINGEPGWTSSVATTGTIKAGSLNYAGLPSPTGNSLTWGASSSIRKDLGQSVGSGSVFYSFEYRVDNTTGLTTLGTLAGLVAGATSTAFPSKVNIRAATGGFQIGTSKGSGETTGGWDPRIFAQGDTLLIVGQLTFNPGDNNDVTSLWINPNSSTFGAATAPAPDLSFGATSGTDPSLTVDRFFFRGASGSPGEQTADELRVGLSWADVTAVPEPQTISLVAGGLLMLASSRRFFRRK